MLSIIFKPELILILNIQFLLYAIFLKLLVKASRTNICKMVYKILIPTIEWGREAQRSKNLPYNWVLFDFNRRLDCFLLSSDSLLIYLLFYCLLSESSAICCSCTRLAICVLRVWNTKLFNSGHRHLL